MATTGKPLGPLRTSSPQFPSESPAPASWVPWWNRTSLGVESDKLKVFVSQTELMTLSKFLLPVPQFPLYKNNSLPRALESTA